MPTATVEVLTAEVRVLMVGNRQVTLSVYRQLDIVSTGEIEPFGRVRDVKWYDDQDAEAEYIQVIGKQKPCGMSSDGELVKSIVRGGEGTGVGGWRTAVPYDHQTFAKWSYLPLIVLAGLK